MASRSSSSSSQLVPHVDHGRLIKSLPRALAKPNSVEPSSPLHLPGFAMLPCELQFDIVQLACLDPASSSSTVSAIGLLRSSNHFTHLDIPTTLSLLTISTKFYDVVVPLLYGHVTLARPSALAAFLQVLSARPHLCKHIKSLYVGDIDQLPAWWNPVFESNCLAQLNLSHTTAAADGYELYISSSLRSAKEVSLLPTWGVAGHPCAITAPRGATLRSTAIREALSVAERCIDVDLREEYCRYEQSVPSLSITEYCTRLHEVQAVFDLYLLEMGRLERAHSRTYPALRIKGYADTPQLDQLDATDLEDRFVVTRSDIAQHLSRARSITDRFDSPLIFARSGIDRKDGVFAPPSLNKEEFNAIVSAITFDSSLPAAATLGSCQDLLRQLLKSTPNITHLSVSSFLDWAVWDASGALHLPTLRCLSIESPHHRWDQLWPTPQFLDAFAHLEELRVSAMHLNRFYIEYFMTKLRALKILEMCLPQRILAHNVWTLKRTIYRLAQHEVKAMQLSAQVNEDEAARATIGNSEHSDNVSTPRPPLTILVRLHPVDYARIVQRIPIGLRAGWNSGVLLPSQVLRLLLVLDGSRGLIGIAQ